MLDKALREAAIVAKRLYTKLLPNSQLSLLTSGHMSTTIISHKRTFVHLIKSLNRRPIKIMAWNIDQSHSAVNFSVKHMMISTVRGQFTDITGTFEFDAANPTATQADIKIGVASINTRDEKRDGHLKSADFFDAANHPYVTFKSSRVEAISGNTAKLIGDLTIRGVSKEVALNVEYAGQQKAPWGTTSAGFTATTQINREDWGLTWNVPLELGGVLVGKEVKLEIELEAVKS